MNRLDSTLLRVIALVITIAGVAGAGFATSALAGPGEPRPAVDGQFKDGRDDDDDWDEDDNDDDDHSGHGRGRGRGGDEDEIVVAPVIPKADLGDVVIEIIDERFVPANATIEVGQRLTVVNLDDDEHTATGIGFDTGLLLPGEWKTVKIERPGLAPFVCQYHAEMTGELTVLDPDGLAATPLASPIAVAEATSEVTLDVLDFAFSETRLEIAPGTKVTWTNTGAAPHTVTGSFGDSGMLQTGDTFSFVFAEEGTFDYVCLFHPDMAATIVVTKSAQPG